MYLEQGAKNRGNSNILGIFNSKPVPLHFLISQLCDPKYIPSPLWALSFPLEMEQKVLRMLQQLHLQLETLHSDDRGLVLRVRV